MLLSMTGFGRAESEFQNKSYVVEVKSLNSKFLDIKLKLPNNYKIKELDIRKSISQSVLRGKIEVNIDISSISGDDVIHINHSLLKNYFTQINDLQTELGVKQSDVLGPILRMPNVINSFEAEPAKEEWMHFHTVLLAALKQLHEFRSNEGGSLEADFIDHIEKIKSLLEQVSPFEKNRIEKIRTKMKNALDQYMSNDNIDENRFEQEVLFYLEKIDVSEEKVRLNQHCDFFLQELASLNEQKGRKLNFISQEMGREINTLGAKANDSDIQRLVILMKDELEKIKEQIANAV